MKSKSPYWIMEHLTLATGHSRMSHRSEIHNDVIRLIRPAVAAGAGTLGRTGWSIRMFEGREQGGAGFECRHGSLWIVSCYMAWSRPAADEMWSAATKSALLANGLQQPRGLPWLAVALMPDALRAQPSIVREAGDMERCVAWTVLDTRAAASHVAAEH